MEQTVRCKFCGKLYVFASHFVGRQDACPSCVAEADSNMKPLVPIRKGDWAKPNDGWTKRKLPGPFEPEIWLTVGQKFPLDKWLDF